mmetsp:Transcript_15200/g.40057  ORF Transcript_15200/g.40057 Transcript_15200/m.40057 type:complete len:456 (+) Transcript_15200:131-1498(+)
MAEDYVAGLVALIETIKQGGLRFCDDHPDADFDGGLLRSICREWRIWRALLDRAGPWPTDQCSPTIDLMGWWRRFDILSRKASQMRDHLTRYDALVESRRTFGGRAATHATPSSVFGISVAAVTQQRREEVTDKEGEAAEAVLRQKQGAADDFLQARGLPSKGTATGVAMTMAFLDALAGGGLPPELPGRACTYVNTLPWCSQSWDKSQAGGVGLEGPHRETLEKGLRQLLGHLFALRGMILKVHRLTPPDIAVIRASSMWRDMLEELYGRVAFVRLGTIYIVLVIFIDSECFYATIYRLGPAAVRGVARAQHAANALLTLRIDHLPDLDFTKSLFNALCMEYAPEKWRAIVYMATGRLWLTPSQVGGMMEIRCCETIALLFRATGLAATPCVTYEEHLVVLEAFIAKVASDPRPSDKSVAAAKAAQATLALCRGAGAGLGQAVAAPLAQMDVQL